MNSNLKLINSVEIRNLKFKVYEDIENSENITLIFGGKNKCHATKVQYEKLIKNIEEKREKVEDFFYGGCRGDDL